MQWYYASAERQIGPVSVTEMQNQARLGNIQPDTLIWKAGMATWQPASQIAEIEFSFGVILPGSLASLAPKPNTGPSFSGPPVSSTGPFVASVLTTLGCCLPFGIVGIVYAAKIGSKNATGDHQGAKEAAKMSYVWSSIALGFGFVTVGLMAAMAIPAFNSVRTQSRQVTLVQDGRQIGNATQQFFLSTGKTSATFTYNSTTGMVSGDLSPWLQYIGKGYTIGDLPIEYENPNAFTLTLPGAFGSQPVTFSDEGRTERNPNEVNRRR